MSIQEQLYEAKKVRRLGLIIWGVALTAQLLNQFHRVAGSVVVDKLMADFSITAATVGNVLAMYFYIYATMQFTSGVLADYLGPRKTITTGCLVSGIGSIIFGLAPSLPVLYLGRFLLSLGAALVLVNVLKIQTHWFQSRYFGRLSSLTAFVGMGGSLIGTTPMALLVVWAGWRLSFELMGLLSFVVCLTCWFVIRDRPADVGLPPPDDSTEPELDFTVSASAAEVAKPSFLKRMNLILTNRFIWPPFLIGIGSYGTLLVFQGAWGIPYLMQVYSMPRAAAANFMLLTMIGSMIGTIIIGYVSDRLQRRKLPAIVYAFMYLSIWIALTLWNDGKPPVTMLYPIFFFMGFFSGFSILTLACAKEVVPPLVSGMAMGLVNMGIFFSTAVLQILFGKMLDFGWQGAISEGVRIYPLSAYQVGFISVCIGASIYLIGALLLKETRCRDIYH
jgi:sugar phosphate permease